MTCTWFQIQINHAYACLASSCRTRSTRQCKCSTAGGRGPHPHPQGAVGKRVIAGGERSPREVGSSGGLVEECVMERLEAPEVDLHMGGGGEVGEAEAEERRRRGFVVGAGVEGKRLHTRLGWW
jgi:hypothetical protein